MTRGLVVCALLLASCAELQKPSGTFRERMDGWIGRQEKQLLAQFGPPANKRELPDGGRILQYPGALESDGRRGVYDSYRREWVTWPRPGSCATSFALTKSGIVASWSNEGVDCR